MRLACDEAAQTQQPLFNRGDLHRGSTLVRGQDAAGGSHQLKITAIALCRSIGAALKGLMVLRRTKTTAFR
jgi:hypothetical protein